MAKYPRWSYFPRNRRAPAWVAPLVAVIAAAEAEISTPGGSRLESLGVLRRIAEGLDGLGFQVERSKAASDKIARPVLFGDEDQPAVTMQIDAFQDRDGIALEVEAGRAWNGNAVYRDLIRISLLLDANFLAMFLPLGTGLRRQDRPCPRTRTPATCLTRSTPASAFACPSRASCSWATEGPPGYEMCPLGRGVQPWAPRWQRALFMARSMASAAA